MTNTGTTFRDIQQCFTAYVREPLIHSPPSAVAEGGAAVYAELIFKNLDAMLSSCFPVLHRVLLAAHWREAWSVLDRWFSDFDFGRRPSE